MSIVFKDFGTAYLAAPLAVGGLTITVDNAASLPILTNGDYFYLVLQKYSDRSYVEIVKVTATAGNTFTILRGQAGTSIRAFAAGDYAELRLTTDGLTEYIAQNISTKMDKIGGGDFTGLYRFLNPSVSRVDLVRTSDSVASSLVVDFSASEGHRTIIGGATGSNSTTPSILLRPNGYGNGTGQLKLDGNGLVDVVALNMRGAQGTDAGSAVRFDYLSNFVLKTRKINNKDLTADVVLSPADVNALPIAGGTLTGPLVVAGIKSAIVVNGQRSISFQDQANTVFHLLAIGNSLRINTGDQGTNPAVTIGANGNTEFGSAIYSRVGSVVRSLDSSKYISMETPEANDPYIAAQGLGMAAPEVMMYLGLTVTIARTLVVGSGYIQSKRSSSPIGVEMLIPGKHARMWWMADDGAVCLAATNGNGVETARLATFSGGGLSLKGRMYVPSYSTIWGSDGSYCAVGANADGTQNVTDGEWHPTISSPLYIRTGSATNGYTSRWSLGHFRTAGANNGATVLAMTGDGLLRNTLRFSFDSTGAFRCEGTQDGSFWSLYAGGYVGGSAFGPAGNMVQWCMDSFAPKSDAELKKNIVDSSVDALSLIDRFRFRSFDWKDSGEHASIGLIAQEVEQVSPEFADAARTYLPDGQVDSEVRTLDLVALISLALKGIQQLNARMPV